MDYGQLTGIGKRRGRLRFAEEVMSLLLVSTPVPGEEAVFLADFWGWVWGRGRAGTEYLSFSCVYRLMY